MLLLLRLLLHTLLLPHMPHMLRMLLPSVRTEHGSRSGPRTGCGSV
jgi:hypothetical protein